MKPARSTVVRSALVVMVALSGVGLFVWSVAQSPTGSSGSYGPYTLDASTPTVGLSFPACSRVTLDWHAVQGAEVNFTVGVGEWTPASSCRGPPPTNESCLPSGCSVNGPQDVCFETGTLGSCSFTNDYPGGYVFSVYLWTSTGILGDANVDFTANYGPVPG